MMHPHWSGENTAWPPQLHRLGTQRPDKVCRLSNRRSRSAREGNALSMKSLPLGFQTGHVFGAQQRGYRVNKPLLDLHVPTTGKTRGGQTSYTMHSDALVFPKQPYHTGG